MQLEWKHSVHAYLSFDEELVRKIISILLFAYISGVCLFIGFALGKFINESSLYPFLILYFFYEFVVRFFFQGTNIPVQIIYLPVSKSVLSNFVVLRNLLNRFNLFSFSLFIPIFFSSTTSPLGWLLTLTVFVVISNLLLISVRATNNLWVYALIVTLAISFGVFNSMLISITMHLNTLDKRLLLILLGCLSVSLYFFTLQTVRSKLFIDSTTDSRSFYALTKFLDRNEILNNSKLLLLEMKLIFRNKRPLYYLIIILFQFYFFLAYDDLIPNNFKLVYWTFINSILVIVYGQFLFAWESRFFQYLIIYADSKTYIKAKLNLLNAIGFINLLCSLPIAFIKNEMIYFLAASSLSLGLSSVAILLITLNNRVRLNLDQNAFLSYQGVSTFTWLIVPVILLMAELIILPFQIFDNENFGLLVAGGLGLIFLVCQGIVSNFITALFQRNKYKMYDGFKNSSR